MEIYAYVNNIGLVVLPLDRMEAPGSARFDDFESTQEIIEKAKAEKAAHEDK